MPFCPGNSLHARALAEVVAAWKGSHYTWQWGSTRAALFWQHEFLFSYHFDSM